MIISTGSRLAPGFIAVDQQLLKALDNLPGTPIDIYAENLDIVRFPVESAQRVFAEYLTAKYAGYPPDLVILVSVGNMAVPLKLLPQLFPQTPILATGLTEEELNIREFGPFVGGIIQRVDARANVELILRLQPETRRIVVIGGTAEIDRHVLNRVREAAGDFAGRVEFEFWDNRTMSQIRQGIAAMPPHTVILYARFYRDAAGQAFISSEVGQSIARSAKAPVYVMTDPSFGTGAVGGSLASAEIMGSRAGELARRIVTGKAPAALPFEISNDSIPTFDWRALNRWGISESRLPPNSVVRFHPESFWEGYRWYILAVLIIIGVQAAIIVELLLERRRRVLAQGELEESRMMMDLAASAGELGLWARDTKSGAVWASATLRSMFNLGANDPLQIDDLMNYIHPKDRPGVLSEAQHAQQYNLPFEGEFRILLSDGTVRWVLIKGRTVDEAGRRMGVVLDITERKRAEEAVRESEERFGLMADAAPVMIWMSGTDKLCTFVNKSWLAFTGRGIEQELGNGWIESVHPEDRQRILDIYTRAFDARQRFMMAYRVRRFDGEYRWVLDTGAPRFNAEGAFLGCIGSCVDITEIHRAEERFRLAVEASANAMVMTNQRDEIVMINTEVEKLFGYAREELLGEPFEKLVSARFRGGHAPYRAEFLAAPQSGSMRAAQESFALSKDGREIPVEIGLSSIEAAEGLMLLTTIVDVRERKHSAEALEKERAFLRQVIDTVPDFIFAKDSQGRFTLANRAVAAAYGTTVEKLIGKTDGDFNHNRVEVEFFRRIDQEVLDTLQDRFIPEERLTDALGNVRWLQTVKRPILEYNGSGRQILGASTDITKRKETEIQLQDLRAELAHVSRISTMGELAASLAHELNQPLTAILSNAQAALRFLGREPADLVEVREILQDIVQDNSRAGEVIRRMRALVKKEKLEFAPVDLAALIQDVARLLHSDAILLNIEIIIEATGDMPPVMGDKVQLQQVVLNLLLNAFDAMKESPQNECRVTILTELYGRMVKVSVSDTGPGLTSEKRARLFQPFFTTKLQGLGMGLSICRSIIEAHQGHLWAENSPIWSDANPSRHGAIFSFTLPIAEIAQDPSRSEPS